MRLGQKPDDMALLLIVDDGQRLIFALLEELHGKLDVHLWQQENIGRTREGAENGRACVVVYSGKMHVGNKDHSRVTARRSDQGDPLGGCPSWELLHELFDRHIEPRLRYVGSHQA